ncbi:uncharacterized protein LOC100369505 [Saccoglossus kowalevskii]|uniref:Uncharacterized protein LOC100369505 n=1 Tax=Saccoglossus kowalevskii TaxID=10224 RepID=A0ABM0GL71_SACKO|nr:PREDICTED: uncharacterized protein LOC100369505 [Saccoglossus kowalevskii]
MPPKTRTTKSKTRTSKKGTKARQCGDSSSDDKDSGATCKVLLRRIPRSLRILKSSTDTEVSEHNENENRIPVADPYAYDGDFENSSSETQSQSEPMKSPTQLSTSSHDMDSGEDNRQVLSPSRRYNTRKKRDADSSDSGNETKHSFSKPKVIYRRPSGSLKPNLNDSGMFVSPDIQRVMKLSASDTSTPSSCVKKDCSEDLFGFEQLIMPEALPFSPVQPVTPSSLNSFSTSSSGIGSMTMSSFGGLSRCSLSPFKRKAGTYDIPIEKPAKRLKKKKMTPKQKVEIEDLTTKMRAQFDDIEMHELCIE